MGTDYSQFDPFNPQASGASSIQPENNAGSALGLGGKVIDGFLKGAKPAVTAGTQVFSKLLPIAGAVTEGYNFLKDRGTPLGNVLHGAGTGASIGSMFAPGVGTLIGGGIGALAGGVKDLFNIGKPSQTELEGRGAQSKITDSIGAYATPKQLQDAQNAGWDDPKQALNLIVTRDALIKQGVSPEEAVKRSDSMVGSMNSAEKQGGLAVGHAGTSIAQLLASLPKPQPTSPGQTMGNLMNSHTPVE